MTLKVAGLPGGKVPHSYQCRQRVHVNEVAGLFFEEYVLLLCIIHLSPGDTSWHIYRLARLPTQYQPVLTDMASLASDHRRYLRVSTMSELGRERSDCQRQGLILEIECCDRGRCITRLGE